MAALPAQGPRPRRSGGGVPGPGGVVTPVTLAHVSDLHFGRDAQLDQIEVLEELIPELHPDAVGGAGDLTQRARHGEFQRALAFVQRVGRAAPTLVIPGNHDTEWWRSPF